MPDSESSSHGESKAFEPSDKQLPPAQDMIGRRVDDLERVSAIFLERLTSLEARVAELEDSHRRAGVSEAPGVITPDQISNELAAVPADVPRAERIDKTPPFHLDLQTTPPELSQRQRAIFAAAIIVGLAGQGTLTFLNQPLVGGVLLLVAITLVGYLARQLPHAPLTGPMTVQSYLGLLAIFIVSLAIRLYQNGSYPPGLFYDEAVNGLEAIEIANKSAFQVWSDRLSGRPTFHLYLLNVAFQLFGVSIETLRGVSAMGGALTVVFTFLAAREFIGNRGSWLAGLIMMVSRWDITYSRIAYEAIWAAVFASATIWLLVGGIRRRSSLWLALAAVPFSVGLYTYVSYRLFIIPIALFWCSLIVKRRATVWHGTLGFALISLLIVTPLLQFAVENPGRFTHRFQEVSILKDVEARKSLQPILDSATLYAGFFNYRGSLGARHNLPLTSPSNPGAPQLGFLFALCFTLGLGLLARRANGLQTLLLVGTLLVAVAAGASTILIESPHATRTILAIPITVLCASLFLDTLHTALVQFLDGGRRLATAIVTAILVGIAVAELLTYREQMNFVAAYQEFQHPLRSEAFYLRGRFNRHDIYVSEVLRGFPADAIVNFVNHPNRLTDLPLFSPAKTIPAPSNDRPVSYLLTLRDAQPILPYLQQIYPQGVATIHRNPVRQEEFATFEVPSEVVHATQGLAARYFIEGQMVERVDEVIDFDKIALPFAPPFSVEWRGTIVTPTWGNYRFQLAGAARASIVINGQTISPSDDIPLAAGPHTMSITAQYIGVKPARLLWARDGAPPEPVPARALYNVEIPPHGLETRYYKKGAEVPHHIEVTPGLAVIPPPDGYYRVRWRGELLVPETGKYRFWLGADDYATFSLDSNVVIDTTGQPPFSMRTAELLLTSGPHFLEIELTNLGGAYGISLDWQPPGGDRVGIPYTSFRPVHGPYASDALSR